MVYNLERKQMELKYLYKYLFAMIQYPCRWGQHESTFYHRLATKQLFEG